MTEINEELLREAHEIIDAQKKPQRSARWAVQELRAIEELYDHVRCSWELRKALEERVWKELEEANGCESKDITTTTSGQPKDPARKRSRSTSRRSRGTTKNG